MKRTIWLTLFILLLFVASGGCAKDGAKTVRISDADNGKTIPLRVDQVLNISLEGNPTTGYNWEVASKGLSATEQIGEPEFRPSSNLIGAGGKVTLRFLAKAKGKEKLILVYRRSWEKEAPLKEFQITIVVNGK